MSASNDTAALAVACCRRAFCLALALSLFISLLTLASPLYMMQIYNRVLPTRSDETLFALSVLLFALLGVLGVLEALRARVLVRIAGRLSQTLDMPVLSASFRQALEQPTFAPEELRGLDALRQFLTGNAAAAFLDSLWVPAFLCMIFLFHPLLGSIALFGGILLFALAVANDLTTRRMQRDGRALLIEAQTLTEANLRNVESIHAMGMAAAVAGRWSHRRDDALRLQTKTADRAATFVAASKSLRLLLQGSMLAAGAWLAMRGKISPGAIIAASVLMGRALAPVEQAISGWKQFISARSAYRYLRALLVRFPEPPARTPLPRPTGHLEVDRLVMVPPASERPSLYGVSFALQPGTVLGVLGPSGAGKSTLARLIVGALQPRSGRVRLDGADLAMWDRTLLGHHIGYLPQDIELLEGTVAENIARFSGSPASAVVSAAMAARAHDIILRLPQGYDTLLGPKGRKLSAGQRQRIGLARALFGEPALVVLDEPNSNLDEPGEVALRAAIEDLRRAGRTVVVVSHRPSVMPILDLILLLVDGRCAFFGPRSELRLRLVETGPTVERRVAVGGGP